MDNYMNALKTYNKNKTSEDLIECPKCKKTVEQKEFNKYYGICDDCVRKGGQIK